MLHTGAKILGVTQHLLLLMADVAGVQNLAHALSRLHGTLLVGFGHDSRALELARLLRVTWLRADTGHLLA